MAYPDTTLGWVQEARDYAVEIGSTNSSNPDLAKLCSGFVMLADAVKELVLDKEARDKQ